MEPAVAQRGRPDASVAARSVAAAGAVVGAGRRRSTGRGGAARSAGPAQSVCRHDRRGGAREPRGLLMDANGQRFWLLADATHWASRSHTAWHAECRTVRLASERRLTAPVDAMAFAAANSALEVPPRAVDVHGAVARWDG